MTTPSTTGAAASERVNTAISGVGPVSDLARLAAENRELRAYLKAFCAATVDPDGSGHDIEVHEANPFIEWEFSLVDEGLKPGRVITGGQVRRAMELVGFDKLKVEPPGRTISDELTEARDLRREVGGLRAALSRIGEQYITNRGDMTDAEALAVIKSIVDAVQPTPTPEA